MVLDYLKGEATKTDFKWIGYKQIIEAVRAEYAVNDGFIKQVLKLFTRKEILLEKGVKLAEKYKWNSPSEEIVEEVMVENFGEQNEGTPNLVKEYYKEYGFDTLVEDVSRWTNHDGIVAKTYDLDRLWLGRYVDFLDKARQYLKWFKADQAIAKKKIRDLKTKKQNL